MLEHIVHVLLSKHSVSVQVYLYFPLEDCCKNAFPETSLNSWLQIELDICTSSVDTGWICGLPCHRSRSVDGYWLYTTLKEY